MRTKAFSIWNSVVAAVALVGAGACGPQRSAIGPAPEAPAPATRTAAAPTSPKEAPLPPAPEPATENPALTRDVPNDCSSRAEGCTPPRAFAEKMCRSKYPELALFLFSRGTPWQRLYVKAERVEPVNVYDGERSDRWLAFGEEVLVLHENGPGASRKVVVSGPTDVDILRWDGTCATIRKEMLVSYVPAPMDSVRIVWRYLDADVQEQLLRDELVVRAQAAER
ncbi:MAG TPA: hypothetical protein VFZ53_27235, partial [Polyangiaceae bacterium]